MAEIKYHLAEDTIDRSDHVAVAAWLITDPLPRLTMGPLTKEFEKKWSQWLGRKYSIFCNSGSSANLLMYATLKEDARLKNGIVVVPNVGWSTTINPAIQLKGFADPIMCEADRDTFALDLNHLENIVKKHKPDVVTLVQVLGVPHKMNELMALKEKYGFILLEDACAAGGSSYQNKKVGTFGDMASFSTYFGHQFSTIEGGIVSTDNKDLYDMMRMLRSHGWGKDLDPEKHAELLSHHEIDDFNKPFTFFKAGYNLRPTDLQAFLGLRQINRLEWLIQRRWENHQLYANLLDGYVEFQKYPANSVVCSIHFGALAKDNPQRKRIVSTLNDNGIENRMFSAGNLGLHPFWYERYGKSSFPVADRIHNCGLFLPNNPSLNREDINFICKIVIESAERKE